MKNKFDIMDYMVPIFLVLCAIVIVTITFIVVVNDHDIRVEKTKRYEICIQSATTDEQRNACNEVNSVR